MEYGINSATTEMLMITQIVILIIGLVFYVLFAIPLMKIGNKKGKTGWFAWVPILNVILMLQIAEKPLYWFVLMLLPLLNIVIIILLYINFFKAIDQSPTWTLALLFPPVLLIPLYKAARELE